MASEQERERRRKITRNHSRFWLGKKRSAEDRLKMSLAKRGKYKGNKNPFFGKTHSEETRKKISSANKGRVRPQSAFKKGRVPWNKGKKQYISEFSHYCWKGGSVGYTGLHNWVRKHLGSPMRCTRCGIESKSTRQIHWANKSGRYKRDLKDWVRLCVKCHWAHDRERRLSEKTTGNEVVHTWLLKKVV